MSKETGKTKLEKGQKALSKGKKKASKVVDFILGRYEKVVNFRNKCFKIGAFMLLGVVGLYACHYADFMSGFAYAAQAILTIVSIPFIVLSAVILALQFYVEFQIDRAVDIASGGGLFRSIILGEVKDRAIETAVERSEERRA